MATCSVVRQPATFSYVLKAAVAMRWLALGLCALMAVGCQSDPSADATLPPPSFAQSHEAPLPPYTQPHYVAAPVVPYTYVVPRPLPAAAPKSQPPVVPHRVSVASAVPAAWIPDAPARQWKWIVIHHTATTFGNEAIVNQWHLDRGFDEMGYHFLIGNGSRSGDGQVEVGPRWPKQKWGAHTKTPDNRFNDFGIGICLVGNFQVGYPTAAQMRSVDKLVAYLMKKYNIPADHVLGHGDCKSTECPGKNFSVAAVRNAATRLLADEGYNLAEPAVASAGELMQDVDRK